MHHRKDDPRDLSEPGMNKTFEIVLLNQMLAYFHT
jgi:hypothetical protein